MKKRKWLLIGGVIALLIVVGLTTGTWHLVYVDGPYHGRVMDKTTGRPIEGAAVVAVWWKEIPFIAQAITNYYNAQETLTDQGGNFTIPGIWGAAIIPLTKIREPLFTIFKPGYEAYRERRLAPPEKEGRTVVELRPLNTRKERLENLSAGYLGPRVPKVKYPNLSKLRSVERKNLGLKK